MFSTLKKRQIAVIQTQKSILDTWTDDCKKHIPPLKSACQSLWQTLIPNFGQAPDSEMMEPFLELLKPFMKLGSAEGRDRLNTLDIGTELGLLSTVLTGEEPTEPDNHSLLRRCIAGLFEFNTNFLDIPWSEADIIRSAEEKIHDLTIREDTFDEKETLIHKDVSLNTKLKELFDTIDPISNRTRYLVAGSREETAVQKAFQRFQNEFYVWAAEYADKTTEHKNTAAETIHKKLAEMVDTMKSDMAQCETAQKNICHEAASRLLLDQFENSIQITLALSVLTVIELHVQSFLAKHVEDTEAARDQHTLCFAMNIVRKSLGISLVEDKYPIQFEGVQETILARKDVLIAAAKEGIAFGSVSDLVCSHLNIARLSKELVDDEGINPELSLSIFETTPESHQIKNDWAIFHALGAFFSKITAIPNIQGPAIYGFIAQQKFITAQDLLSSAAWNEHPGITENQEPADRLHRLLAHANIPIREFAVTHGSLWLLQNAINDMFEDSFLINIIQHKKPQIIEWLEATHQNRFVVLCISERKIFLEAIKSGDPSIFGLVKKSLSHAEISFPDVFRGTLPVHLAIIGGSTDILEILIRDCGFSPTHKNPGQHSPLSLAVAKQQTGMIRTLRRVAGDDILNYEPQLFMQEIQSKNMATTQALIEPLTDNVSVMHVLHRCIQFLSDLRFGEFILDALADAIKRESQGSAAEFVTKCQAVLFHIPNHEQRHRLYEKLLLSVPSNQIPDLLVAHLETLEDLTDYCFFVKRCSYTPLIAAQFEIRRNEILETKYRDQCPLHVPDIIFNKIEDKIKAIHQLYDAFFSFFASAEDGLVCYKANFQEEYAKNLVINKKTINPHICMPMFQTALLSQLTKKPQIIEALSFDTEALIQGVINKAFEIQIQSSFIHAVTAKELCEFLKNTNGLVTKNHVIAVSQQLFRSGKEAKATIVGYYQALLHTVSHLIDKETLMALGEDLIAYQPRHTYQDLSLLPVFIDLLNTSSKTNKLQHDEFTRLREFTNSIFTESNSSRKGPQLDLRYEGLASLYTLATEIPEAVGVEDIQRCLSCTRTNRYKWVTTIVAGMASKETALAATYENMILRKLSDQDITFSIPIPLIRQLLGWISRNPTVSGSAAKKETLSRVYMSGVHSLNSREIGSEIALFLTENIADFPELFPVLIDRESAQRSRDSRVYLPYRRNTLMAIPDIHFRIDALTAFYTAVLPFLEKTDPDCHLLIHEIQFQMAAFFKSTGFPNLGIEAVLNGVFTGENTAYAEAASKCHIFLSLSKDIGDRKSLQALAQNLHIEATFHIIPDTPNVIADLKTRLTQPSLMDIKHMLTLSRLSRISSVDFEIRDGIENAIVSADYIPEKIKHQLLSWIPLPDTEIPMFLSDRAPTVLAGRIHAISRRNSGSGDSALIAIISEAMYQIAESELTDILKEIVFDSFFQLYDPETLCVLIQEQVSNTRFNTTEQARERLSMYKALGWHQKTSTTPIPDTRISKLMQEQSESILGSGYSDQEKSRLIAWTYALSPAVMNLPKTIKQGPLNKIERQSGQSGRLLPAIVIATTSAFPWLKSIPTRDLDTHLSPFFNTPQKKHKAFLSQAQLHSFLDLKNTQITLTTDTLGQKKPLTSIYRILLGFSTHGYALSKVGNLSNWLPALAQTPQPTSSARQDLDLHRKLLTYTYCTRYLLKPSQWASCFLHTTNEAPSTEKDYSQLAASYEAIALANTLFSGFFSGGPSFLPIISREFQALNALNSRFKDPLLAIFTKSFKPFFSTASLSHAHDVDPQDDRAKRQRKNEEPPV